MEEAFLNGFFDELEKIAVTPLAGGAVRSLLRTVGRGWKGGGLKGAWGAGKEFWKKSPALRRQALIAGIPAAGVAGVKAGRATKRGRD